MPLAPYCTTRQLLSATAAAPLMRTCPRYVGWIAMEGLTFGKNNQESVEVKLTIHPLMGAGALVTHNSQRPLMVTVVFANVAYL